MAPVMLTVTVMVRPVLRADVDRLAGSRVRLRASAASCVRRGSAGQRRSADSHRDKEILHVITPVEISRDNRWASVAFRRERASKRRRRDDHAR
jgi:hypothetical protein